MFKTIAVFGMILFLASNIFAALPPGEWDKMRRSGYSSEAIDKFISLDKSASAGITHGGHGLDSNEEQISILSETNLVSQINIIGDGIWFTVSWKNCINPPKKVTVIDPSRLILSEGEYKRTRKDLCYYRVPDTAVPLASSIPFFAVPKMRLAELAYYPSFQKEQKARIAQLGIYDDPRIGRISDIKTMNDGQVKAFCKWTLKAFTPEHFKTLSIFDRELNFVRSVMIESSDQTTGDFKLADVYGTVLAPQIGDLVFPLAVANELCVSQGRLLFQNPEKPLQIVNIYGTPTFSTASPSISHSFPEFLFPGLYRFGVTRNDKDQLPCTQFAEIIIQKDITAMVDFGELKESLPENNRGHQVQALTKDSPINLDIKRFSIRYFRNQ